MRIFNCTAVYTRGSFIVRCVIFLIFAISQTIDIFCFFTPLYKSNNNIIFYALSSSWIFFTLLWIWSYIVSCWMDAGSVEQALYKLGYVDKKGHFISNIELPIEIQNLPRCEKCQLPKPSRTHHCSQCDKCYFRFDHHCEVVGNCIAYNNMKSFILFLFYSSILLFLSCATAIISYKTTKKVNLILLIIACILGFFLGIVIFVFAFTFVPDVCINNRTTIEKIAGIDPKKFNAGFCENIKQIFGCCPLLWILPTRPKVDGFVWSAIYSNNINADNDGNASNLVSNIDADRNLIDQEMHCNNNIESNGNESLNVPLNPKNII